MNSLVAYPRSIFWQPRAFANIFKKILLFLASEDFMEHWHEFYFKRMNHDDVDLQ